MLIRWKETTLKANLLSHFTYLFLKFSLSPAVSRVHASSRTLSLSAWAALLCIISFSYGAAWCSEPGSCRSLSFRRCAPLRERVRLPVRAWFCMPPAFSRASPSPPRLSIKLTCRYSSYTGASFDAPVVAVIAEAAPTLLIFAPFAPCVGVSAKHSQCAWQQNGRTIHIHSAPPHPPSSACFLSSFVKHRGIHS